MTDDPHNMRRIQAGTPVVAINRPLLEAYNAMWDAGRELGSGEPKRALPAMYAALATADGERRPSVRMVLLKGHHTLVATPDGRVRVTTTGVPWLATAGAGSAWRPRRSPCERSLSDARAATPPARSASLRWARASRLSVSISVISSCCVVVAGSL